jgi:hypothetical protein
MASCADVNAVLREAVMRLLYAVEIGLGGEPEMEEGALDREGMSRTTVVAMQEDAVAYSATIVRERT